jgi:hypothetical protein
MAQQLGGPPPGFPAVPCFPCPVAVRGLTLALLALHSSRMARSRAFSSACCTQMGTPMGDPGPACHALRGLAEPGPASRAPRARSTRGAKVKSCRSTASVCGARGPLGSGRGAHLLVPGAEAGHLGLRLRQ